MYPDLYKGLRVKAENFSKYDTPLVGFDGRMVILKGQISLPVNTEGRGDSKLHCGELLLLIHCDSQTALDPCYRSCTVHLACEGEVPHQARDCHCKRRSTGSKTMFGSGCQSGD